MANPVERKFEQKCFQKLRMLGPENHFGALRIKK